MAVRLETPAGIETYETNHYRILCSACRYVDRVFGDELVWDLDVYEFVAWRQYIADAGWRYVTVTFTDGHHADWWCCPKHPDLPCRPCPILTPNDATALAERLRVLPGVTFRAGQLLWGQPCVFYAAGNFGRSGPLTSRRRADEFRDEWLRDHCGGQQSLF